MSRIHIQKTSFASGEISPRLLGRGDLRAYENGAAKLRNVFIHPTGGVTRRAGLRFVAGARGPGRLVAFEFNTEQVYLLAFSDGHLDVLRDGEVIADVATPWTAAAVAQINWTQSADTLLVAHPEVAPKKITRAAEDTWSVSDWSFVEKNGRILQPHHRFADDAVTLTPSGTTGAITVSASAAVFQAGHVGTRLRIGGREVEVTGFTSATQVPAMVKETLAGTGATNDWEEQAFSAVHGWPASVCFHQDRLVIGGSRDLPNRLWMSKSSDLFNFDLGEGLDDEAIEFAILSDQVNAVRHVFSGRHLQVFTSGAEWMVMGSPLTPENVEIRRQTRLGSPVDRTVPPRDVDGATLFVPREGPELREFLYTDVEQAYQANDLAMLAQHLIDRPLDQDFDKGRRLFHMVMANGTLATVTIFRAEQVTAWTRQETDGLFHSVAVVGDETFVLVEREGAFLIEAFDDALNTDSALTGESETPGETWTGLDHLEGREVTVVADGAAAPATLVEGGTVTLAEPAGRIEMGLPFAHEIEPLPPAIAAPQGSSQGAKVRPVAITFRLQATPALTLDTGRGFTDVPFKRFGAGVLNAPPPPFTGDRTVRAFGWRRDGISPLWRIRQDAPFPFTLLSVATEISVND